MELLKPHETCLIGRWIATDDGVIADQICSRIDFLVNEALIKLADSADGWESLYKDPVDNRLWELTYPESDQHGSGAPRLELADWDHAKNKYEILNI